MRGGLTAGAAVIRCQGGAALVAGAVTVVVLSHIVPMEPVRVVGRPDVRSVIWPLVPAVAAAAVPIGAAERFRAWVWVAARPAWQARTAFILTVVATGAVIVALVPVDRVITARNLALFDGLALVAVVIAGRPTWALLTAVVVVTWFAGVDPPDVVRWWAVPLLPGSHRGGAAVATAVALVGAAAHIAWPPRP